MDELSQSGLWPVQKEITPPTGEQMAVDATPTRSRWKIKAAAVLAAVAVVAGAGYVFGAGQTKTPEPCMKALDYAEQVNGFAAEVTGATATLFGDLADSFGDGLYGISSAVDDLDRYQSNVGDVTSRLTAVQTEYKAAFRQCRASA